MPSTDALSRDSSMGGRSDELGTCSLFPSPMLLGKSTVGPGFTLTVDETTGKSGSINCNRTTTAVMFTSNGLNFVRPAAYTTPSFVKTSLLS